MNDEDLQDKIEMIVALAEELGWNIVITKPEIDGEPTPGIIMGTAEFFDQVHMDPNQIEDMIEFSGASGNKDELH